MEEQTISLQENQAVLKLLTHHTLSVSMQCSNIYVCRDVVNTLYV